MNNRSPAFLAVPLGGIRFLWFRGIFHDYCTCLITRLLRSSRYPSHILFSVIEYSPRTVYRLLASSIDLCFFVIGLPAILFWPPHCPILSDRYLVVHTRSSCSRIWIFFIGPNMCDPDQRLCLAVDYPASRGRSVVRLGAFKFTHGA